MKKSISMLLVIVIFIIIVMPVNVFAVDQYSIGYIDSNGIQIILYGPREAYIDSYNKVIFYYTSLKEGNSYYTTSGYTSRNAGSVNITNHLIKDASGQTIIAPNVNNATWVEGLADVLTNIGKIFKHAFDLLKFQTQEIGKLTVKVFKTVAGVRTEVVNQTGITGQGGFTQTGNPNEYQIGLPAEAQQDGEYEAQLVRIDGTIAQVSKYFVDTKPFTASIEDGSYDINNFPDVEVRNDKVFSGHVILDNDFTYPVGSGEIIHIGDNIKSLGPGTHTMQLKNDTTGEVVSTRTITLTGGSTGGSTGGGTGGGTTSPGGIEQGTTTGSSLILVNPGELEDGMEDKVPIGTLKQSLEKLKQFSQADYRTLAPKGEINLNQLLNPVVSTFSPELVDSLNYQVTYFDFSVLNDITFMGIPAILYFRNLLGALMVFGTLWYMWRKITPKDVIAK